MKSIYFFKFLLLFGSFISSEVIAQNFSEDPKIIRSNYIKVEFAGYGASVNLAGNRTQTNSTLLSNKSDVGMSATIIRVTHLFSPRLGWYAAGNLNLFKEQKSPYYNASFHDILGEFALSLFYGGYIPSPIAEAGLVYRIQRNKWDINPRLGFGYSNVLVDRDSDQNKKLEDGSQERALYKQRLRRSLLNCGLGANYFFGRRSFIALNATLQQPLQKSYAELTLFQNDVQTDYKKYSSTSIGRDLNLTVGYGFFIGNRKVSY